LVAGLHWILSRLSKPSRYLGNEPNAVHKDPSSVRLKVALAFPDTYEIGMSHLGLKILYHLLNSQPEIQAERAFAPWVDAEELMRREGIPLCSQESGTPLSCFHILGFTLQYELCYTNILTMLELAGIPWRREERGEEHPLVIAGGPGAFNPEPLAEFIDLFVIGDGEDAILEIAREALAWVGTGKSKIDLLERLARYPGMYCPALHLPSSGLKIVKRLIPDLDSAPHPTGFVVPFLEIVHDRLTIEVSRGCSQGCRFCQAGMVYRPVRERSPEQVLDLIRRSLRETGYEEISLFSLNTTEYSCLEDLLPLVMEDLEKQRVSLSLPSLRVEGLRPSLLQQIKRVRRTGLTLAPEAGSQRLRDVINKGLDEESVLRAARVAAAAGWEGMKFYFMVGLPEEREDDLEEIVRLCREAVRVGKREGNRRFHLAVSLSPFIPKPHTPFQWTGMIPLEEIREKMKFLRDRLPRGSLSVKWQSPEMSLLEGAFSRGDRLLAGPLVQAQLLGCRFDEWTERLRFDLWQEAFSRAEVDLFSYSYRRFDLSDRLPWDHISTGLSKEFLVREYLRARRGEISPNCRVEGCLQCGLDCRPCNFTCSSNIYSQIRVGGGSPALEGQEKKERGEGGQEICYQNESGMENPPARFRLRFQFQKGEEARYLSHLEILRTFSRAARRASIPIGYSRGFHPQPRISLAWALPVGICGEQEWGEMELERECPIPTVVERLNRSLPSGLRIGKAKWVPLSAPPLEKTLSRALYEIIWDQGEEAGSRLQLPAALLSPASVASFLEQETITVTSRRRGKEETSIDLKPLIVDFHRQEGTSPLCWRLTIKLGPGRTVPPTVVMAAFFANYVDEGKVPELIFRLRICRKELT